MGTEIYWHGILDYSGRENRRIREVRQIREKLDGMREVAGARYEAEVGVLKDYDNIWDAQLDVWHQRVDRTSQKALFEAAQRTHTPLDYVYLTADTTAEELGKYKVLIYPHMTIVTEAQAEILKAYVAEGGVLVIGCRSGYKNVNGQCVTDYLPGLLRELTGADIPEYSFIAPDAGKVTVDWDGTRMEAETFADLLEPLEGAHLEAKYTSDYYAGAGTLVSNTYGKGTAYYYGSAFNEASATVFLEKLGVISPYSELVEVPECCEIAVRTKGDARFLFILNYDKAQAEILLRQEGLDLYTQNKVSGRKTLDGYGTMVIRF